MISEAGQRHGDDTPANEFRETSAFGSSAVDHELSFAMLTKAQARQHHTDAETGYKNVDTNHTQTIHKLYTTQI